MIKESATQKRVIKRVMHEYKHGDLESGSGQKIHSRKQAIAIGLKEAGASRYASPEENMHTLKHTKQKEKHA